MRDRWKIGKRTGAFLLAAVLLSGHPMFYVEADEPAGPGIGLEQTAGVDTAAGPGISDVNAEEAAPGGGTVSGENVSGGTASGEAAERSVPSIYYAVCQNQAGWVSERSDDLPLKVQAGNVMSALKIRLQGVEAGLTGTILYGVNVSGRGWGNLAADYGEAGASAEGLPLEAVKVSFNGTLADYYDVYYSVWQNGGWTGWVSNGTPAGTEGSGLVAEGFRAIVVNKGEPAPQMKPDGVDPSRPMVALTFDDGPSTPVTSRIINSLEQNGGRATFFMVGNRVPGTKAMVQRMTELGCQVGNHTYEHKYLTKLGDAGIRSQVGLTNDKVTEAGGVTPIVVRPPGGYYDKASLSTLGSMGMSAIMWNIDTRDWQTKNAQNTINVVLSQVKDGDIILMHDIYQTSADAAEVIIPELVKRGYQLVTVSELAQYRGGLEPGKVYSRFRP